MPPQSRQNASHGQGMHGNPPAAKHAPLARSQASHECERLVSMLKISRSLRIFQPVADFLKILALQSQCPAKFFGIVESSGLASRLEDTRDQLGFDIGKLLEILARS